MGVDAVLACSIACCQACYGHSILKLSADEHLAKLVFVA